MKTMKASLLVCVSLLLSASLIFVSCQKDANSGKQQVSVFLTDDPTPFDAVNIDIQAVEVKVDTCTGHDDHFGDQDDDRDDSLHRRDGFGTWVNLNFTAGVYNVAELRNGIETLLGSTTINGTVRKIRLTLGTSNTVVVNGTSFPLQLVNPTGNYLYVKLNDRHRGHDNGNTAIRIDFDLGRSIRYINGTYYLLPVLRPFCDANFAQLAGKVLPAAADVTVTVYNSSDTATAIPNPDGYFKVRGLQPGTYSVLFDGVSPYRDTTITNVQVYTGRETKLAPVTLGQ